MKKFLLIPLIAVVAITANMPLTAQAASAPSYNFNVSKTEIIVGQQVTLSWNAAGATKCIQSAYDLSEEKSFNKFAKDTVKLTPAKTTQYSLQCFYGKKTGPISIVKVAVKPAKTATATWTAKPTISFTVSPLKVQPGQGITLTWNSQNTSYCQALSWNATPEWNSKKPTAGSMTLFPSNTTTYELRCYNAKGTYTPAIDYTVNVTGGNTISNVTPGQTVTVTNKPQVFLNSSSDQINQGDAVTLNWSASNTTYCLASTAGNASAWSSTKPTSGYVSVTPQATTTYVLSCYNNDGSTTAYKTVNVRSKMAATMPQMSLGASKYMISRGENINLSWNTAAVNNCVLSANATTADSRWQNDAPTSGVINLSPLSTTNYSLSCSNPTYSHAVSITVVVNQSPICTLSLPNSLINRWNADNTTTDSVGGIAMTNHDVHYTAGKSGSAFDFDGVDDYATIARPIGDDFTIAMNVKTTQTGGTGQWWNGRGLIDGEVANSWGGDFGLALVGDKAGFGIGYNGDNTILSTTPINDGQWHHIAITRIKSTGEMRLYVDGRLEAFAIHAPNLSLTTPSTLTIGASHGLSSSYGFFRGQIDEIQVYKNAVSALDIAGMHYGQCR